MTEPEITVYGAHWCPDCRRSNQSLGEHQIPYDWVDIEQDQKAEQLRMTQGLHSPGRCHEGISE